MTVSGTTILHRGLISSLMATTPLARGLCHTATFVMAGGLISYGARFRSNNSEALPGYVDRILKGEKPADLPVQAPTKYELVINLKTAKGARPHRAANAARPRRRGDRIELQFAAVHKSAIGT